MNVIVATGKPVVIDVINEFENTGKNILKVPYEEGIRELVCFGQWDNH